MKDLAERIAIESLVIPNNGLLVLKVDVSKSPGKAAAQLNYISNQLSVIRSRLSVPVIIVPKGIALETMTHDEMRVLGII